MAQALEPLPPKIETQMKLLAPGFGLAHPAIVAIWIVNQQMKISFSLSFASL